MYDSQQSTGLPDHPALWNLMDTNVSPHENVSWRKKMESPIYRKVARGNGAKMIWQYISCALKWGEKDVSKNGSVLLVPCTWTVKTSTERITSSSRAGFLVHAKKNMKSLPESHSSHSLLESSHRRKRDFFYFCLWHVRDLDMSALFSGARHFLPQMKTKIHPPGWIINNTQGLRNPGFTRARRGWKRSEEGSGERKWRLEEKGGHSYMTFTEESIQRLDQVVQKRFCRSALLLRCDGGNVTKMGCFTLFGRSCGDCYLRDWSQWASERLCWVTHARTRTSYYTSHNARARADHADYRKGANP